MKYKVNQTSKQRTGSVWLLVIVLGLLVIFLLNVAYRCSETARDRLYPNIQVFEDGSFIMINKDGTTKYGCMTGGVCQEDRL